MSTNISKARQRVWASFIAETTGLALLIGFYIFLLTIITKLSETPGLHSPGFISAHGIFISLATLFGVLAGAYLEYRSFQKLEKTEFPRVHVQRIEEFIRENKLPRATFLLHRGFLPVAVMLNYPRQIVSFERSFFNRLSERQIFAILAHELGGHVRHFDAILSLAWEWAGMSIFFAGMSLVSFLFDPSGTLGGTLGLFLQWIIPVACLIAFTMTGGNVMHYFPSRLLRFHDYRADACTALIPGITPALAEVLLQFEFPPPRERIAKLKELEY